MILSLQAHLFDEWCSACGCIHTETVLSDAPAAVTKHGDGEEEFVRQESNVMANLSTVLNKISQIKL